MIRYVSLLVLMLLTAALSPARAANHVLSLDGEGDYVEIPTRPGMRFSDSLTFEAWVYPHSLPFSQTIAHKKTNGVGNNLWFGPERSSQVIMLQVRSTYYQEFDFPCQWEAEAWYHVALTYDDTADEGHILINGMDVVTYPTAGPLEFGDENWFLGVDTDGSNMNEFWHGYMDEVRLWNVARTPEQIRESMHHPLSGNEPGLVGYWTFEGEEPEQVLDFTGQGHHGTLGGDAKRVPLELPEQAPEPTLLTGRVTDESGNVVSPARVVLQRESQPILEDETDERGEYGFILLQAGDYSLSAAKDYLSADSIRIRLVSGQRIIRPLVLKSAVSIAGTVLMLDDETPHVGLMVEAVSIAPRHPVPKVRATAHTDRQGHYRFSRQILPKGEYAVRCKLPTGDAYYAEGQMVSDFHMASRLKVQRSKALDGIDFRLPPFKKGVWRSYTARDGLITDSITTIHQSSDGVMWFGTAAGLTRYDGVKFIHLTGKDGLPEGRVNDIDEDSHGNLWIGTDGGLAKYDGAQFQQIGPLPGDEAIDQRVWRVVCATDDTVWLGARERLFRWDGTQFRVYLQGMQVITDVFLDSRDRLWVGTSSQGVLCYDGQQWHSYTEKDGLAHNTIGCIQEMPDGSLWFGTGWNLVDVYSGKGVSYYDGTRFETFTVQDGLCSDSIHAIASDSSGRMWIGSSSPSSTGISHYDGLRWVTFTTDDGLVSPQVNDIHVSGDGTVWFATTKGISRYDEHALMSYTVADGLAGNEVRRIDSAPHGKLWVSSNGGFSLYDGQRFVNFSREHDLGAHDGRGVYQSDDGALWLATYDAGLLSYEGDGLRTFHGKPGEVLTLFASEGSLWIGTRWGAYRQTGTKLESLNRAVGWPNSSVNCIASMPDGTLWFGTLKGAYRYDGQRFHGLTVEDGLIDNVVHAIYCDATGFVWFGTNGGVSQYDGNRITNFTTSDGLAHPTVLSIYRTADGLLCFGTRAGVSLYDGVAWSSLDTDDGLAHATVNTIHETEEGVLWLGTDAGITCYRRSEVAPQVQIDSVVINRRYDDLSSLPPVTRGKRITVQYSALDFKTQPQKHQYRSRIEELDANWSQPAKSAQFDWIPEAIGTYTFQVQAIDRDLNYSRPASVVLMVVNPFYLRAVFLIPTVGGGSIMFIIAIVASVLAIRRRRQVHAYERYAAQELQEARQMQMALMPKQNPEVQGAEVAGKCMTANTVGGDFFAYLTPSNSPFARGRTERAERTPLTQVGLVVADVSGHAMKGAMNAVMTDGILHSVVETHRHVGAGSQPAQPVQSGRTQGSPLPRPGDILTGVNDILASRMESDMNVTMVIALLDTQAMTLTIANAAHHAHPLLVRDGEVQELKARGLPLGMRAGVEYQELSIPLQPGDMLVLMTDGIIESHDADGRMYGESGRLEQVLTANVERSTLERSNVSAATLVDAIIDDVTICCNNQREDDMTVVVVRVQEQRRA